MTDPVVQHLVPLQGRVAGLENQRERYVQATVTAINTGAFTFSAQTAGQIDGRTGSLAGIPGKPPFLPSVGDTVLLKVAGSQPVYEKTLNTDATLVGSIQTAPSGQRVRMSSSGHTFYPAGAGTAAMITSVDDAGGNAGISANSGGATHGGLNFTSTFADIGHSSTGSNFDSFVRASSDPVHGISIGVATGKGMAITMDTAIDLFHGAGQFAQIGVDNTLHGISKFGLDLSGAGAYTFGVSAGGNDADVYALRFISTNPGGTGGFIYFSDGRLKTNIADAVFSALPLVMGTKVRNFNWRATGAPGMGLIAQEVPPGAQVHLSPDQPMDGLTDPMAVSADLLVIYVWKAVQELAAAVNTVIPLGI